MRGGGRDRRANRRKDCFQNRSPWVPVRSGCGDIHCTRAFFIEALD